MDKAAEFVDAPNPIDHLTDAQVNALDDASLAATWNPEAAQEVEAWDATAGDGLEGEAPEPKKVKTMNTVAGTRYQVGELLPWKGLWFEVEDVDDGHIVLKAIGLTKRGEAAALRLRNDDTRGNK